MDDNMLGGFGSHHNNNNFPPSNYGNGGMHGNNMYRNTAPNFMRPSQQQQGQQNKNNFSIWLQSNTREEVVVRWRGEARVTTRRTAQGTTPRRATTHTTWRGAARVTTRRTAQGTTPRR